MDENLMGLIISKKDKFDDSSERAAWEKFCVANGYEYNFYDKLSPIDCTIKKPEEGKVIGINIELACNACWKAQEEYPEEFILIPLRKFNYFKESIQGCSINAVKSKFVTFGIAKCDKGYFVLINSARTRIAFLNFKQLIKHQNEYEEILININGSSSKFLLISKKYIQEYKDIG
jgi:hypothetical protein